MVLTRRGVNMMALVRAIVNAERDRGGMLVSESSYKRACKELKAKTVKSIAISDAMHKNEKVLLT